MTARCRAGHDSTELDYCSVCGAAMPTAAQGAAALDRALGGGSGQIGVVPVDWPKFFAAQVSTSSLFAVFAALGTKADPANAPHMEALAGKSRKEAQAWVLNYVATQVAAVLGLEAVTEVAHGRTFIQMGMDSLTSVELRNRLQKGLGLALAATLAFEFPTVPAMAGHP